MSDGGGGATRFACCGTASKTKSKKTIHFGGELITRETEIADYLAREFAGPIMEPWIKATGDIRAPMSAFALISPAQGLRIRDGEHTIKAFDPRVMAT